MTVGVVNPIFGISAATEKRLLFIATWLNEGNYWDIPEEHWPMTEIARECASANGCTVDTVYRDFNSDEGWRFLMNERSCYKLKQYKLQGKALTVIDQAIDALVEKTRPGNDLTVTELSKAVDAAQKVLPDKPKEQAKQPTVIDNATIRYLKELSHSNMIAEIDAQRAALKMLPNVEVKEEPCTT